MKPPLQTNDETGRLKALRQFHLLDTPREQVLDDLTTLAARICETPISLVTLIDEDRGWFKSNVGMDATELQRDTSFCTHTILQRDLLEVPDAKRDERFANSPLVTGEPHVRFYAGAPLITPDGYAIGTLSVLDRVPRTLTPMQQETLRVLSRQVMAQLEIRRQAHELATKEQLLRAISDAEPDCVKVLGPDGSFRMLNRTGLALIEADSFDEVAGRSIYPLIVPEDRAKFEALTARVFNGEPGMVEFQIVGMKGARRWLESHATLLRDERGESTALLSITRDVTERRRMEHALRESERRMNTLFNSSPAAICVNTVDAGRVIDINEQFLQFTGFAREELIGQSIIDLKLWAEPEARPSVMNRLKTDGSVRDVEAQFRRKNGELRDVLLSCELVELMGESAPVTISMFLDVTERRLAEEVLREKELEQRQLAEELTIETHRLRESQAVANVGSWEMALATREVKWTDEMFRIFETSADQFTPTYEGFLEYVHPEDRQKVDDTFINSLGQAGPFGIEHRMVFPNGRIKFVEERWQTFSDAAGNPLRAVGTCQDITKRKRAEEALRASESKFRQLAESNILGILFWDTQGNISEANDAFLQMLGYTREELERGQMNWRSMTPPGYLPQDERALAEIAATGSCTPFEKEFFHKDGHRVAILLGAAALDGAEDRGICYVVNISQQKQAEATIRVSEERFRLLSKATNDAIWDWNLITNQVWWNEGYEKLFGYAREEMDLTVKSWTDHIHPDDLACVTEGIHRVIGHGGEAWSDEYRFRRKNGRYAHVLDRGYVLRDDAGKPVRMIGGMTDLTTLKEHEIALSQSNRALQLLSRCNEALIRSETESELLAAICQIAVDVGHFRLAWVGYPLEDADKSIVCQSYAGIEDSYLSEVRMTWAENDPAGQGPAGRVIRHGEPVVIPDLEADESFRPWLEAARVRGFRGVIVLPLTDEKRTFGVLVLYLAEARQPMPDEVHLLRELADNMAFGIVTIRTRLDRRRLHTAVEQVAAAVSAATSNDFFEQLARNMAMAVGAQAGFVAKVLPGEPSTSRTIAAVVDNQVTDNFDYVIKGTPCESFFTSDSCVIHQQVAQQFPQSPSLAALGAEGFVGRRLDNSAGKFIGQLFVIFREPLKEAEFVASTLQIFSARAAAELEREETDTRLREQAALLDKAQDAILVRDLDHHITYWNRSAARLYGWTAQEVLGRSVRELLYAEPGVFDRAMAQVLTRGEWTGELRHKRKDGRILDIEGRWTLVRDAADQPKTIFAIDTDITERRAAELAMQKSEERFRELAENIQEVFWITDPAKSQMLYISPAYEIIWGRTCASLYESPQQWLDAIHPDDRARVLEASITKQALGEFDEEYRIQRPDGTVRWIHDRAFPVRGDNGEVVRIVGTAEDITERRQHERLAQRSQRLESIGTLAGGIAHDLNNALTPIMMSVALLRMEYPGKSQALDMVEDGGKRAADMVRHLLTFAKGASGERVSVQPGRLVKELEKLMKGSFPKNIRLVIKCDAQLPSVLGDATQLHQLLLNLCVNARDAMPDGGTLTLEVDSLEVDAIYASSVPDAKPGLYVRLCVRDTGTGIPPEILDRIFDPFFTTKGSDKGTGLGLSTVMGIVKGHGGFLQVHSQPGQGSTFTAYFAAKNAGSNIKQVTEATKEFRGQGETILFVDDEASIREIACIVLRRLNFKPLTATDGTNGLMQVIQHRTEIRAIITDLHMPNMDGLAFVRALRRMLPDIPVVVASGRMDDALADAFKTLGTTSRLDKPFTEAQLAAVLKKLLAPK